jgi:hypothetical protein
LNAALISLVTAWLSDMKMGYCTTGWWLSQKFCCAEISAEGEACEEWRNWGGFEPFRYIAYVLFAVGRLSSERSRIRSDTGVVSNIGVVLVLSCQARKVLRSLRCRIGNIGDQMYIGRVHHQWVLEHLDLGYQEFDFGRFLCLARARSD